MVHLQQFRAFTNTVLRFKIQQNIEIIYIILISRLNNVQCMKWVKIFYYKHITTCDQIYPFRWLLVVRFRFQKAITSELYVWVPGPHCAHLKTIECEVCQLIWATLYRQPQKHSTASSRRKVFGYKLFFAQFSGKY